MSMKRSFHAGLAAFIIFAYAGPVSAYYSANLGRWIKRDPIEEDGGHNLQTFVFNWAVNGIDPHGLKAGTCVICCEADIDGIDARGHFDIEAVWACMSCDEKYRGTPPPDIDEECRKKGYIGRADASECKKESGWLPPPCSPDPREPCNPKAGVPAQLEEWFENSPNWCRDTKRGQSLHGERSEVICYREITVPKPKAGLGSMLLMVRPPYCPSAGHVCFSQTTGHCEQEHVDKYGQCQGKKADGYCDYSNCCAAHHISMEVVAPRVIGRVIGILW